MESNDIIIKNTNFEDNKNQINSKINKNINLKKTIEENSLSILKLKEKLKKIKNSDNPTELLTGICKKPTNQSQTNCSSTKIGNIPNYVNQTEIHNSLNTLNTLNTIDQSPVKKKIQGAVKKFNLNTPVKNELNFDSGKHENIGDKEFENDKNIEVSKRDTMNLSKISNNIYNGNTKVKKLKSNNDVVEVEDIQEEYVVIKADQYKKMLAVYNEAQEKKAKNDKNRDNSSTSKFKLIKERSDSSSIGNLGNLKINTRNKTKIDKTNNNATFQKIIRSKRYY